MALHATLREHQSPNQPPQDTRGPQPGRDPDPILCYGTGGTGSAGWAYSGPNATSAMSITSPGLYFVRVTNTDNSHTGPYNLWLSAGTNNNWGFKTQEYNPNGSPNNTSANAAQIRVPSAVGPASSTGVPTFTSGELSTTVSGAIRVTGTAAAPVFDTDWYFFNIPTVPPNIPSSQIGQGPQNVTYVFDLHTYNLIGASSLGSATVGFKFPDANLRLTLYSSTGAGLSLVADTYGTAMDSESAASGQMDPFLQWTPPANFIAGNYCLQVSFDPSWTTAISGSQGVWPVQVVGSTSYYDLHIARVYEGMTHGTSSGQIGMIPEIESNQTMTSATDLDGGTGISFDNRDPGGTAFASTNNYLAGIVAQGYLSAPTGIGGAYPYPLGDLDFYKFNAIAGQMLSFEVLPLINASDPLGAMNAVLTLYDSAGNVLAMNDNTNFGEYSTVGAAGTAEGLREYWPSITAVMPKTGTYYIEVSGAQQGSQAYLIGSFPYSYGSYYDLVIEKRGIRIPELNPVIAPTATLGWATSAIDLTQPQPQTLSGKLLTTTEQDKYNVSAQAGQSVSFQLSGGSSGTPLDGRLQLLDSNGNPLLDTFSFGPTLRQSSFTYQFLTSGVYQIVVSSNPNATGSQTGSYTLLTTTNPANIRSNIVIGGNLDGQGTAGLGLISVLGSLLGGITLGNGSGTIGNVVGNGRIEIGTDAVGPISIGNLGQTGGSGTDGIYIGAHIRTSSQIRISGSIRDTGSLFTRFTDGVAGPSSAPMWVKGTISNQAVLAVAPPGGQTGYGNVFYDNNVANGGNYKSVPLFNLDSSGTLSGFYADITRYPQTPVGNTVSGIDAAKAYAAPNAKGLLHDYVTAGFTPVMATTSGVALGAGSPGAQVQMYYDFDRYHSYMCLLGYSSTMNRTVYADEDEVQAYQSYPTTGAVGRPVDVDFNQSMLNIRVPQYSYFRLNGAYGASQSFGSMSDEMFAEYNQAVNEALMPVHGYLYPYGTYESPAINSGLADYRAASLVGNPWVGDGHTDGTPISMINNGLLRLADNLYRYDTSQYQFWANYDSYQYFPHMAGRVLTGALWDLRSVLGQQAVDTLSMAALNTLDKVTTWQGQGVYMYSVTLGPVYGSTMPNFFQAIQTADGQLFNAATHAVDLDRIQQAFAIHGLGTYDFTGTATSSGAPVGTVKTLFAQPMSPGEVDTVSYQKPGATSITVTFDKIVTQLAFGDTLTIRDINGNLVTSGTFTGSYTPPVNTSPPDQANCDYGRGLQGKTIIVPGNTVQITLTTSATNNPVSLGFRAFIDPPGSGQDFVTQTVTPPPGGGSVQSQSVVSGPFTSSGSGSAALLQSLLGTISASSPSSSVTVASGLGPVQSPVAPLGPVASSGTESAALLQSLLGAISVSSPSSDANAASGAPAAQILTVGDVKWASQPLRVPPLGSSAVFSLRVYNTVAEATGNSPVATAEIIGLNLPTTITMAPSLGGAFEGMEISGV